MLGTRLLLLALTICSALFAIDWPQWRGPNRDGKSAETGLLQAWPAAGPPLVWKAQGLGEGYAAFSIVGDRLYTQGQHGNQQFVYAYDTNTGKQVWKTPSGKDYQDSRGHGPRGTPTTDGTRLYAVAAEGTLLCLDAATGKPIWTKHFVRDFGGSIPRWGYSESPLIDGDRVIVTPGGRAAAVVALNKLTGATIWKSQNDPAAYSSAMPYDAGGKRNVVVFTSDAVIALDMKTGEQQWRYSNVTNRTANIATPIISNAHIFVSSDYGTGGGLLKLPEGKEVWFSREMKNHYSSSVLLDGYLYGFSSSILTAMNFMTGEVAWRDRSVGKGSVAYADRRLYALGENGTVGLIDPTPAGYKEVSRFEINRGAFPTWTPPVIANGKMYLREQDNLYCYNIKR
jgi:outer membrane protein assembly factor BamB